MIAPLIRRRGGVVEWLDVTGLPLGMVDDLVYHEREYLLHPGDAALLATDGIVEAMNARGEIFGFERFAESIMTADADSASSLLHSALARMNGFIAGEKAHDDVTMVVVMVKNS